MARELTTFEKQKKANLLLASSLNGLSAYDARKIEDFFADLTTEQILRSVWYLKSSRLIQEPQKASYISSGTLAARTLRYAQGLLLQVEIDALDSRSSQKAKDDDSPTVVGQIPDELTLPPKFGEYLLCYLPKKDRADATGDLAEIYDSMYRRYGKRCSDIWYYYQVWLSLWPYATKPFARFSKWIGLGTLFGILRSETMHWIEELIQKIHY